MLKKLKEMFKALRDVFRTNTELWNLLGEQEASIRAKDAQLALKEATIGAFHVTNQSLTDKLEQHVANARLTLASVLAAHGGSARLSKELVESVAGSNFDFQWDTSDEATTISLVVKEDEQEEDCPHGDCMCECADGGAVMTEQQS